MTTKLETLIAKLQECQSRIGNMCSEGRPPKMSIPARPDYDDDLVICQTIRDTIAALSAANQQAQPQVRELTDDEIVRLADTQLGSRFSAITFARAVIAASQKAKA